jgi:hypothetical protein
MRNYMFLSIFFIATLVAGAPFVEIFPLVAAQTPTNVSGVISQDTTWSTANSPYNFTNKALVKQGVTLTIQPGVTVNLNGYYIEINGTLAARGTSNNPIQFNSGALSFRSNCIEWSEQAETGCIIENAVLNATSLYSYNTIKINKCTITGKINAETSIISNNNIDNKGTGGLVLPDVMGGLVSGNTIIGSVSADTITNNTITGEVNAYTIARDNIITGNVDIKGNCTISNNYIQGDIVLSSGKSTIAHNTIKSAGTAISINPTGTTGYVQTNIQNNRIIAKQFGITMTASFSSIVIAWHSIATISENIISDCANASIQLDESYGQHAGVNKASIEGNVISNSKFGILTNVNCPITGNLILNNRYGVSGGKITDNTIINNTYGVIGTACSNNNIENNNLYNFALGAFEHFSVTANMDASNNWWGTINATTIDKTIYDVKDDFDLGTVTYVPFLTAPNSAAPSINYTPTAGSTISPAPSASPSASPSSEPTEYPSIEYSSLAIIAILICVITIPTLLYAKKRLSKA